MRKPLTREEAAALDRAAISDYGIAGIALMENAGAAVAREALRAFKGKSTKKVVVVCGRGNNGGDGFVAARHLLGYGLPTSVFLLCRKEEVRRPSDAATNLDILERMAGRAFLPRITEIPAVEHLDELRTVLDSSSMVVDAVLGTGLSGPAREPAASAINAINSSGAFVIAVDVPSGLDCNQGLPLRNTIKANVTVTFVGKKVGFENPGARDYLGRLVVAEIGCGFLLKGQGAEEAQAKSRSPLS